MSQNTAKILMFKGAFAIISQYERAKMKCLKLIKTQEEVQQFTAVAAKSLQSCPTLKGQQKLG